MLNRFLSFFFFVKLIFLFVQDISEYQFGEYECRGENNLGQNSAFINIEENFKILKIKENEINRNGRTALLINNQQNLNSTWLLNKSFVNKYISFYSYLLIVFINLIRPV